MSETYPPNHDFALNALTSLFNEINENDEFPMCLQGPHSQVL